MYIGDIYVPTVSELSSKNAEKVDYHVRGLGTDYIYPIDGLKQDVNSIVIKGLLYKSTNDPKNANDYAEDLMALEERSAVSNYIHYGDSIGFLSNIKISCPNNLRRRNIREYEIEAKFFPYSLYQHGLTYRGDRYDDAVYYCYPRIFILPEYATNVHLANDIDIVPLEPIGYITDGEITPSNIIPIFRPFPVLNEENYDTLTGNEGTDSESLTGTTIELEDEEYVEWTVKVGVDIPRGVYKVKFRAKETTNAPDIGLTITGSISGEIADLNFSGPSTFKVYETVAISFTIHEELTIKVSKLNIGPSNTVILDYIGFNSQFSVMVLYDHLQENGHGPVKLYDTVLHSDDEDDDPSNWKRVYSLRHKFEGDLVVQNELMSWRLDLTKTWAETGILTLRDVEEEKHLWPDQFSSNYPDIQIIKIEPYYIELESAKVSSLGLVKTRIIVDPLMFRCEVFKNESVSGYRIACTTSDLAFTAYDMVLTVEDDETIATTTSTEGFFAIIPQAGYNGTNYKHLLFDAFNKPTIKQYINKRRI